MKSLITIFFLLNFPLTIFAEEIIKIGAMLHLSGEFAIQGQAFQEGVELAAEKINQENNLGNLKLGIVYEDTQYKPLTSNTVAKKLVSNKQVIATVISTLVEAKAAANVLEKNKLPSIVLWDSSPELDQAGEYIFSIGPWAPASGEKSAEYAIKQLNAKSAIIIHVQTEWSNYVSDFFEKKFQAIGGKVVKRFSMDPNEQDFRTVLLKAKAEKVDVIYAPVDSNIMTFFKQLKDYNLNSKIITSDILDKELFDEGGDIFNGIYQTQTADADFAETRKMIAAYKAKYKTEPGYLMYTSWGYDAVNLIASCIKDGARSREAVKTCLYKINNFQGASGLISFNPQGSAPRDVKVFRVSGHNLISAE